MVIARSPDRPVLAILADQVAVPLRFVGVDGLDFVLVVGFGKVIFKIPKVECPLVPRLSRSDLSISLLTSNDRMINDDESRTDVNRAVA